MSHSTEVCFRIGAVSKTTGIPVSTLRIWEVRYGAFSPLKTEGKQRLFTEQDVAKALLLKQLADDGHAIGTIARLDMEELRRMRHWRSQTPQPARPSTEPLTLAVVGLGCAWDAALGLLLLLRPGALTYRLAAAGVIGMTLLATVLVPTLWLDPFGALLKNLPVLALLALMTPTEARA